MSATTPGQNVAALIEARLRQTLQPVSLVIEDESALHVGHSGAEGGGGHYRVRVVAASLSGLGLLARHRLICEALAELMGTAIHALAIEALAPDEV
jgi:BolA protein